MLIITSRILLVSLALLSVSAHAQTAPPPRPAVELVGEFAVELGGDVVAELFYTDGSTTTMRAGQGGTVSGGIRLRPSEGSPLSLRTTVGYKFVLNPSTNSNARLTRVPVEIVAAYDVTPDVWVGAGYVLHAATKLNGDGFLPDLDFDPAHGGTVEVGWRWFAATATLISYTDELGNDYNANAFGASAVVGLPLR